MNEYYVFHCMRSNKNRRKQTKRKKDTNLNKFKVCAFNLMTSEAVITFLDCINIKYSYYLLISPDLIFAFSYHSNCFFVFKSQKKGHSL